VIARHAERLFLLAAMLCGFCICAEYAITRPVSNSVFMATYGSQLLPYAWLIGVPLNFGVVSLYKRLISRIGCWRVMLLSFLAVGVGNLLLSFFLKGSQLLPLLLYLWKDIYILLMFQQLWSVIHSVVDEKRSRYLYGVLFGLGGIGGGLGSLVPGFLAVRAGSEHLLVASLPIYLVLAASFYLLLRSAKELGFSEESPSGKREKPSWQEGFRMVVGSRALTAILLLVVFMQVASALVDFQFQTLLSQHVPVKDLRTAFEGKVSSVINLITLSLQFFGTYLLVRWMGLKRTHMLVPTMLGAAVLSFFFFPIFPMMTFCFILMKSFDFSLFQVVKEMLYIPLSQKEKFSAKAVIDVFVYRAAKAFASLLILLMAPLFSSHQMPLTVGALVIFLLWGFTVQRMISSSQPATA